MNSPSSTAILAGLRPYSRTSSWLANASTSSCASTTDSTAWGEWTVWPLTVTLKSAVCCQLSSYSGSSKSVSSSTGALSNSSSLSSSSKSTQSWSSSSPESISPSLDHARAIMEMKPSVMVSAVAKSEP